MVSSCESGTEYELEIQAIEASEIQTGTTATFNGEVALHHKSWAFTSAGSWTVAEAVRCGSRGTDIFKRSAVNITEAPDE